MNTRHKSSLNVNYSYRTFARDSLRYAQFVNIPRSAFRLAGINCGRGMKSKIVHTPLTVCLCAFTCAALLYFAPAAIAQRTTANASVRTSGGLQTITFEIVNGRVIVHLPDDMAAGDTISGTIITAPKGSTAEERAKTQASLEHYVLRQACDERLHYHLTHNAPDRRVFANLDACNKTGNASVHTTSPKTTFNITDEDITDNRCPSPPPK